MSRPQLRPSVASPSPSLDDDDEEDETRPIYELTVEDAKTILCKVVERAILDIRLGPNVRSEELREAYRDAKQWIFSDDQEFPSFLAICGYIDLDPDAVREKVMEREEEDE